MTNKNKKAFATILVCAQALFLFLGITVFSGCSGEEEEKLNFENKVYIPNLADRSITILPARKSDEPDCFFPCPRDRESALRLRGASVGGKKPKAR